MLFSTLSGSDGAIGDSIKSSLNSISRLFEKCKPSVVIDNLLTNSASPEYRFLEHEPRIYDAISTSYVCQATADLNIGRPVPGTTGTVCSYLVQQSEQKASFVFDFDA
jgi:hypothetical protein